VLGLIWALEMLKPVCAVAEPRSNQNANIIELSCILNFYLEVGDRDLQRKYRDTEAPKVPVHEV
jgi:hypothetical protein